MTARPVALPLGLRRFAVRLAATPALVVGLIVTVGAAFAGSYAVQADNWFVMTDELLYQHLALHIDHVLIELPTSGDYSYGVKNVLYPLLIALPYNAFSTPVAYYMAHALNALVMASTAVPAYLLARAVMIRRRDAYVVAALTVTVPWMTQSMVIWTEAVAYPAFAWAVLGMQRALVRPRVSADLLAVAGLLVAYLARTQFLSLALVFPVAVLAYEFRFASGPTLYARIASTLRSVAHGHKAAVAVYLAAAAGAVALAIFSSLARLVGSYASTLDGELIPAGLFDMVARLLGNLAVGSAVVPLAVAIGWLVTNLVRPKSRETYAAALLMLLACSAVLFTASSFLVRFGDGLQDRYVFYVLPLVFVAFAAFVAEPRRYVRGLAIGTLFTAWVIGQGTYEPGNYTPLFWASPLSYLNSVIDGRAWQVGHWFGFDDLSGRTALIVAAVATGTSLLVIARRRPSLAALALPLALVYCVGATAYVSNRAFRTSFAGPPPNPDWIDDAVPSGESVTAVPGPNAPHLRDVLETFSWWDTLFWNKAIAHMYSFRDDATYGYGPRSPLRIDWRTGDLTASQGSRFWLMPRDDRRFRPAVSRTLASDSTLELLEVEKPYRARWAVRNSSDDGWVIARQPAQIRVYGSNTDARVARLRLILSTPAEITSRRPYSVRFGRDKASGTLEQLDTRAVVLRGCVPSGGHLDARLYVPRGNRLPKPDRRIIGLSLHTLSVRREGPCNPRRNAL
jgi:hypothetical protein